MTTDHTPGQPREPLWRHAAGRPSDPASARDARRPPGSKLIRWLARWSRRRAETSGWRNGALSDPERLVTVSIGEGNSSSVYVDVEDARVLRSQDAMFEALHLHAGRNFTLTRPGEPQDLRAELIEPGFLRTLGTPPALGREFLPEETVPGRDRVVMLSDELWRSAFGADPAIVGTTIFFDDEPYTVVGVMPAAVRVLPGGIPRVALPLTDPPPESRHALMLLGRIRADLPLAAARARLDAVSARLEAERPREAG